MIRDAFCKAFCNGKCNSDHATLKRRTSVLDDLCPPRQLTGRRVLQCTCDTYYTRFTLTSGLDLSTDHSQCNQGLSSLGHGSHCPRAHSPGLQITGGLQLPGETSLCSPAWQISRGEALITWRCFMPPLPLSLSLR